MKTFDFQAARERAAKIEAANWAAVEKSGCSACYYNIAAQNCPYPCGQQHCWLDIYEERAKARGVERC